MCPFIKNTVPFMISKDCYFGKKAASLFKVFMLPKLFLIRYVTKKLAVKSQIFTKVYLQVRKFISNINFSFYLFVLNLR